MKLSRLVLASAVAAFIMSGSAMAAPITYIFSGTGSGSLDGASFSSFTLTLAGDTSNITSGGGEYNNIVGTATVSTNGGTDTLAGLVNEVVVNTSVDPAFIGFEQIQSTPPYAVAEALVTNALASYDLSTAVPVTTGSLSFSPSTYDTTNGTLVLNSLASLSFQATSGVSAAPEPSTWALMIAGLGIVGGMLRFGRRRGLVAIA
jgi:hypothetical protein